jgi:hypothetical protein
MRKVIMVNSLVFVESAWYNTVGFVLCQDRITREYKCYTYKLGGDYGDDYSEEQDINKIMSHGSTFPMNAAENLFSWDTTKDWCDEHAHLFL